MREEQIIFSVFQFSPRFMPREENKHSFPQYPAITSDLATVHGGRAIASWLYQIITRYRALDRFPRTQGIRSGHAFGDHVVNCAAISNAQSVINLSRHTCVMHERRKLRSIGDNFIFIVHFYYSMIVFVN